MADKENALGTKTIIAIVAVIVLLFIASISVGIFLADKGSSEAVDGNQVADVNQNTDANNTNTESPKNDDNNANNENKQNENIQAENNNQTGENNTTPDNTTTEPNTGAQNNVTTPNNNGTVANNNANNNGTTNNVTNNVTANNGNVNNNATNNTEITTGTDVNEVGETTVTRVEEEEKLVSKDFWDWWTPASVLASTASAVSDTIVPTTPDFTVEKFATTETGKNVVYAGENITYTIKVTNNGEKDLNNIEITDKIPENTTFVSFDDIFNISKGTEIFGRNNEVVGVKWIVSVPGHKENEDANSVFVRFTVNVNKMMLVEMDDGEIAEVPTTGIIANTAIANGQESNEEKTAIITSNKTSEITRDGQKVEVAKIGDEIKYTIKVTNTGDVDGITTISDNVPVGTILKENSAEGAIISENNTKLEWKNITVPAGESVSKTFIVIANNFDDLTENKITNVATVGGKETDETEDPIAIDITVSKVWDDANNQDGYRPEKIKINLIADEEISQTVEIVPDEQGNWLYTFENLPKFDNNGNKITYKVREDDVPKGYEPQYIPSENGFTIINSHTPELVNETGRIEVSKVWNDANNQDGYRPEKIEVNLLVNGKVKTTVEVKADEQGNWSYTFEDLPKFENGKEIVYTVTENVVKNYTTEITGSVEDGFVITNAHTPELVNETGKIEVSKVWNDSNDQDGYRPEKIEINLLANGKVKTTVEVKADEQGNWSYTFEDLPKFENGKEIVYTVTENVVKNYTTEITGSVEDGFVITNTHTPELVNETGRIEVSKVWNDANNQDGYRPEKIEVNLLANGKVKTTVEVKADEQGNWSYTFEDLPKFENGKEIVYTVTENVVESYKTEITGSVAGGFVITNTLNELSNNNLELNKNVVEKQEDGTFKIIEQNQLKNKVYKVGDIVWYSITVKNTGDETASRTVTDTIPTGIKFISVSDSSLTPTFDANTQTVTWKVRNLNKDESRTIYIKGEVTEDAIKGNASEEITIGVDWWKTDNTITTDSKLIKLFIRLDGNIIANDQHQGQDDDEYTPCVGTMLATKELTSVELVGTKTVPTTLEEYAKLNSDIFAKVEKGTDIETIAKNINALKQKVWNEKTQKYETLTFDPETQMIVCYVLKSEEDAYHIDAVIRPREEKQINLYEIENVAVSKEITSSVTINVGETIELVNTIVKKDWKDKDAIKNKPSVTVQLYANKITKGQPVVLNADNNWEYKWTKLHKYDSNNNLITYTVKEIKVGNENVNNNETSDYYTDQFIDDAGVIHLVNTYKNITINKKVLMSTETETKETKLDVMFILDVSGSMNWQISENDSTIKAKAMVDATNQAITEIMNKNEYNRVGVVMFSDGASKVLELGRYSPIQDNNSTDNTTIKEFFKYNYNYGYGTITTNVTNLDKQISKSIYGGTYTQAGIALGADMLVKSTDTTGRTPVMILLTDGEPTYGNSKYYNNMIKTDRNGRVSVSESNLGNGSNTSGDIGYYTILTANYYKKLVNDNYKKQTNLDDVALMYTIGIGLTDDFNNAVLEPNSKKVNKCNNNGDKNAEKLYQNLTSKDNPYKNNYNYANDSWTGKMDSATLSNILKDTVTNIPHYGDPELVEKTTNINKDVVKVELSNIDDDKNIIIKLDGAEESLTIDDLITRGIVEKTNSKYYINLKASLFDEAKIIYITYYELKTNA